MSSEIKTTNILHPSSSSNNLVLGSDGNVSITNTLSAGTLGSSVVVPASIGGTLCYIDKAVSSGSTTVMEFDNLDNSYAYYKFVIYNVIPTTDNKDFYVSLGTSSSYLTGSSDYLVGASQYTTNDATYNNITGY